MQQIGDHDERGNGILAQAIISLGHSLNLTVIAEGVETEAQLKFLKAHQCDEVQGFYFGQPTVPEEFRKMLAEKRRWSE